MIFVTYEYTFVFLFSYDSFEGGREAV